MNYMTCKAYKSNESKGKREEQIKKLEGAVNDLSKKIEEKIRS